MAAGRRLTGGHCIHTSRILSLSDDPPPVIIIDPVEVIRYVGRPAAREAR